MPPRDKVCDQNQTKNNLTMIEFFYFGAGFPLLKRKHIIIDFSTFSAVSKNGKNINLVYMNSVPNIDVGLQFF